jgi:hypothetical protein
MKTTVAGSVLVSLVGIAGAQAQNVNVIVSGEVRPGVYGRVTIGNAPPPLVYTQPVVIVRERRPVPLEPVYVHVPPGHAKKWSKHCHKYQACNRPVYFVKSVEYEPGYKHNKGKGYAKGHDKGKGKGRD